MEQSFSWIIVALAVPLVGMLVVGAVFIKKLRGNSVPLTPEERKERSSVPLSLLQKVSLAGLVLGIVECDALYIIFRIKGGSAEYWDNDSMRLLVVAIFIGTLVVQSVFIGIGTRGADERELRAIKSAPQFQVVAIIIGLVLWQTYLGQKFHDTGAIPVVYNYLTFGTIFILYMMSWFAGVLCSNRFGRLDA
jgi:hypothetical protein